MTSRPVEESVLFAMMSVLRNLEKNTNESIAHVSILLNSQLKPYVKDLDSYTMNPENPSFKEIVEYFIQEVSICLANGGDPQMIATHKTKALKAAKHYFGQFKTKLKNEQ